MQQTFLPPLPMTTVVECQPFPASWTGVIDILPNRINEECQAACAVHPACRLQRARRALRVTTPTKGPDGIGKSSKCNPTSRAAHTSCPRSAL